MKWIIQDNLYKEDAVVDLIKILDAREIHYELVKVIPFTDGQLSPDPDIADGENAIVVGSGTLNKYGKIKKFFPAPFTNDKFRYSYYNELFGEHMLNYNSAFVKLKDASDWAEPDKEYFIRPDDDGKAFAGTVMMGSEIGTLLHRLLTYNDIGLDGESLIMFSPLTEIYCETRLIISDQKVITASNYKQGGRVMYSNWVDQDIINYAQARVDFINAPARVFVLDVARTPDGLKIIELNNFNSAGWYHCDVSKIVDELIEKYDQERGS